MPVPDTRMSTPASAARCALSILMPPSISISTARPCSSITRARPRDLVEHLGDERLAAEAGLHAHHEQQVDLAEVRLDRVERRLRLEREPDAHPERADLVEQRARVAELDVHGAAVGARVGERARAGRCGLSTIRWQSRKRSVCLRNDFTTGGPIVRFGT